MGQELTDLSFEEWVKYLFDHPVTDPAWYWGEDRDYWDENKSPAMTVSLMTQLFENAGEILAPYSDAQINQSFWYIDSEIHGYMYTLHELRVPLSDRLRCINSIYKLFEQVFAVRCSPYLSHRLTIPKPTNLSTLNSICYMWWDIAPLYADMDAATPELAQEVISVMKQTLQLNSIACQESALHGLGHWKFGFPKEVESIIDTWLKLNNDAPDALIQYAINARTGMIQ